MSEQNREVIGISGLEFSIWRQPTHEIYMALQPPDASPYVVAPYQMPVNEIAGFLVARLDKIQELRSDMLRHFKKTGSLRCRFRTGDIAHLLGRPFMLRSYPLSTSQNMTVSHRGRASVHAQMYNDISVIDLFVVQAGNYDQGRAAFFSHARPIFARNSQSLVQQCMARVFPENTVPTSVNCRPMRNNWVFFGDNPDTVWLSESLIPYPPEAVVYAYLVEAVRHHAPDSDVSQREQLLEAGVINWREMRDLLADPNNRYAL